jgi:hypothetical protein
MIADPLIGDIGRLDAITISGKFFIEANNNFDGWIQCGFVNLDIIDSNPISENQPFVGMTIIEPADTHFRAIGLSSSTLGGRVRGSLPETEIERVPVGKIVTFTFTWTPDPITFGNGEFNCRFDWDGGGFDSFGVEINEPDVTEWTFTHFVIGMGAAASPDVGRQADVWFDDISYTIVPGAGNDPLIGGTPIDGLEDWFLSDWFGAYNTTQAPWLFHAQHGFVYRDPGSTNASTFFYDDAMVAWWYTDEAIYPFIYGFGTPADNAGTVAGDAWLWYFEQSKTPRTFGVVTGAEAGNFLFFNP